MLTLILMLAMGKSSRFYFRMSTECPDSGFLLKARTVDGSRFGPINEYVGEG